MSSTPYFKLYFSDLAGDTLHLSDAEMGSYVLLLGAMWNKGGALPLAPEKLARIARVSPAKWPVRWAALVDFFIVEGESVTHKRLTAERKKTSGISELRSEVGAAGAEAKRLKLLEAAQAIASGLDKQNGDIPDTIAKEESPPAPEGAKPKLDLSGGGGEAPDEIRQAFDMWNATAMACALPLAKSLDENRRRAIRKRLEAGGLERWRDAMTAVECSAFLRGLRAGRGGTPFRADLTFVCQASSFQKLIDGAYGQDATPPAKREAAAAPGWTGPARVWDMAVAEMGEVWARSWLGRCTWRDIPPAIVSTNGFLIETIGREVGHILRDMGIGLVEERAA